MNSKPPCEDCKKEHKEEGGLCPFHRSSYDDLKCMCVGPWANQKHHYLRGYLDILSGGMRSKWSGLCYLDLFGGPGRCIIGEENSEIDGSPLIAATFAFNKLIFVDKERESTEILEKRLKGFKGNSEILCGDCNEIIEKIISKIPFRHLCLAFIDPFGLCLPFQTLTKLTKERSVDLIINFPMGMSIKRNLKKFLLKKESLLDGFMGDSGWREEVLSKRSYPEKYRAIYDYYRDKLKSIGYSYSSESPIIVKNKHRTPMYYLLFASKHPRGLEFWKKIGKYDYVGQSSFL